jgi:hypothetical protein
MPYKMQKSGSGFKVVGPSGPKSRVSLPRERALAQMRALYANTDEQAVHLPKKKKKKI